MVAAKLGSWMSKAKDKYSEQVENPESRVNHVKRSVKGSLIKVMLGAAADDEKYLVHKSILDETTATGEDLKPTKNSCDAQKTNGESDSK